MKRHEVSRRDFVKPSVVVIAVGALGMLYGRPGQAAVTEKLQTIIAGYDCDRVRAIMDGQAGIEGAEINFCVEDIYALNKSAFGPER